MINSTGALVMGHDVQLLWLDRAIAEIEELPPHSRRPRQSLLEALREQRATLIGDRRGGGA